MLQEARFIEAELNEWRSAFPGKTAGEVKDALLMSKATLELCLFNLRFVEWNEYQGSSHWQIDNVSEEDLRHALSLIKNL